MAVVTDPLASMQLLANTIPAPPYAAAAVLGGVSLVLSVFFVADCRKKRRNFLPPVPGNHPALLSLSFSIMINSHFDYWVFSENW